MPEPPIVTLTTDFGLTDHFVGTMKGVILNINPAARLVDLSHHVSPYDVLDGALTLELGYRYFPPGAIHLVVVDPGVGSSRRPILVHTAQYKFVAPDNGVLSLIYRREQSAEVRHITAERFFLKPVSNTFHGRDIFAPVAAWLSRGVEAEQFGDPITDCVKITLPRPQRLDDGRLRAVVIKVDHFGNLITGISPADMAGLLVSISPRFRITIKKREITQLHSSYAAGKPSELFAIWGSSGYLEICQNRASAANTLDAGRGTEVELAGE